MAAAITLCDTRQTKIKLVQEIHHSSVVCTHLLLCKECAATDCVLRVSIESFIKYWSLLTAPGVLTYYSRICMKLLFTIIHTVEKWTRDIVKVPDSKQIASHESLPSISVDFMKAVGLHN